MNTRPRILRQEQIMFWFFLGKFNIGIINIILVEGNNRQLSAWTEQMKIIL